MNENENNLNKFINKLDPFKMMIYNESDIYQKETKLIWSKRVEISTGLIRGIFKMTFFTDIDEDKCYQILNYVLINREELYSYHY